MTVFVVIVVVNCGTPGAGVSKAVVVYTVSVVVDEGIAVGITFTVSMDEGRVIVVVVEGTVMESVMVTNSVS